MRVTEIWIQRLVLHYIFIRDASLTQSVWAWGQLRAMWVAHGTPDRYRFGFLYTTQEKKAHYGVWRQQHNEDYTVYYILIC